MRKALSILKMPKLHQQLSRGFAFDTLHDLAGRQVRRTREEYVNVITRYRSLQDLYLVGSTDLSNQVPQTYPNFATQYTPTVFGDPDKMVLQIKTAMWSCSVVFHGFIS